MIIYRLGHTVTNNDRKRTKEELYEIEKEEVYDHLVELVKTHNKKEEYKHHYCVDLDYYAMRDIEKLFTNDDDDDNYYKPILVKYLKNNYKYYESRGHNDKKLSVKQYLY